MSATAKRSAKVITGERLAEAGMTLGNLVGEFGWIVNVSKLNTLTHVDLEWIDGNTSMAEDLVCPDNVWRIIDIPREVYVPGFKTENDAKALASALLLSRQDFINAAAEPRLVHLSRMLKTIPENGIVTPFGDVFCQQEPLAIWFGRKAGRVPALHDEPGLQAIAKLFECRAKISQPATAGVAKAERPADAKRAAEASSRRSEMATVKPQTLPIVKVSIHDIASDPENDRKTFDKAELQELAQSIMRHGVLQPILLRPDPDRVGYGYLIVAGERRWRAAKLAGLTEMTAQLTERDGLQVSLARLDENLKRVDLSPIEKAQALKRLMDAHALTQKEVGEAVGVQQGQVSNMLRLLNLPDVMQQRIARSELAPTLVRPLLPFADIPAIVQEVDLKIKDAIENEEEITASYFETWVDQAVEKCTRSMRICADYHKPTKAQRCFETITKEQEIELDVRDVDGSQRAFNVAAFDRLNKEPLKKKIEAYRKKHKATARLSDGVATKEKPLKDYTEHRVGSEIRVSMMAELCKALEKDCPASTRILMTLALHGCFSNVVPWCNDRALKMFGLVSGDAKQTVALLRKNSVKCLKDSRLTGNEIMAFAQSIDCDVIGTWKASKAVVDCFTMSGLKQVAIAIDVNETLAEAKLRAEIVKQWPAGYVPSFLNAIVGIKPPAKKAKAA